MKKLTGVMLITIIFIFSSCDGGNSKFTGKWKPVKGSIIVRDDAILAIEKDGDQFNLTHENPHTIMSTLQYDRSLDCLTGDAGGITMVVKYNKQTRHITLGPKNMGFMDQIIELERAN